MEKSEIIKTLIEKANGNRWTKNGKDRIYFDPRNALSGLKTSRYNTGNISGATLNGELISNSKAKKLLSAAFETKLWYDLGDGKFHWYDVSNSDFAKLFETYRNSLIELIK